VNEPFLAIINPAAGGGRCGERVGAALDRLRAAGIALETAKTGASGEATRIARDAYLNGYRKFLAVGGDGTAYEIVNGLFPDSFFAILSMATPAKMVWCTRYRRWRRGVRVLVTSCG
jgi:diacylglycerol kinase family enzyme